MGRESHKGSVAFSEPSDGVYKGSRVTFSWNEILERARKIAHNSIVNMEATKGRKIITST